MSEESLKDEIGKLVWVFVGDGTDRADMVRDLAKRVGDLEERLQSRTEKLIRVAMEKEEVVLQLEKVSEEAKTAWRLEKSTAEERDTAKANYQWMVEHAADQKLDGYRELGQRAADAENEREKARTEIATLKQELSMLREVTEREQQSGTVSVRQHNALRTELDAVRAEALLMREALEAWSKWKAMETQDEQHPGSVGEERLGELLGDAIQKNWKVFSKEGSVADFESVLRRQVQEKTYDEAIRCCDYVINLQHAMPIKPEFIAGAERVKGMLEVQREIGGPLTSDLGGGIEE